MQAQDPEGYREAIEHILSAMPLKARLAGLTPEQRLAGLTPEQIFAGLTPEQRLHLLRLLDAELLGTAPEATLAESDTPDGACS